MSNKTLLRGTRFKRDYKSLHVSSCLFKQCCVCVEGAFRINVITAAVLMYVSTVSGSDYLLKLRLEQNTEAFALPITGSIICLFDDNSAVRTSLETELDHRTGVGWTFAY